MDDAAFGRDMSAGDPAGWEIVQNGDHAPEEVPAGKNGANGTHEGEAPAPAGQPDDFGRFEIKIDGFEGPLELLLHLVREHRLDIHDIPIAFITEQYLRHVELLKRLNINLASEYLVMASWLIYAKSRTLLPQTEEEAEEEEDAAALKRELERQLIEYQKFKKISQAFRHAEEEQSWLYTREGGEAQHEEEETEAPPLEVTVFDLVTAIQHLIESIGEEGVHLVDIDELEVADMRARLLDTLESAGAEGVLFHTLFQTNRVLEVVATFLALLELIKGNLVVARQASHFSEIRIMKAVPNE